MDSEGADDSGSVGDGGGMTEERVEMGDRIILGFMPESAEVILRLGEDGV